MFIKKDGEFYKKMDLLLADKQDLIDLLKWINQGESTEEYQSNSTPPQLIAYEPNGLHKNRTIYSGTTTIPQKDFNHINGYPRKDKGIIYIRYSGLGYRKLLESKNINNIPNFENKEALCKDGYLIRTFNLTRQENDQLCNLSRDTKNLPIVQKIAKNVKLVPGFQLQDGGVWNADYSYCWLPFCVGGALASVWSDGVKAKLGSGNESVSYSAIA